MVNFVENPAKSVLCVGHISQSRYEKLSVYYQLWYRKYTPMRTTYYYYYYLCGDGKKNRA